MGIQRIVKTVFRSVSWKKEKQKNSKPEGYTRPSIDEDRDSDNVGDRVRREHSC